MLAVILQKIGRIQKHKQRNNQTHMKTLKLLILFLTIQTVNAQETVKLPGDVTLPSSTEELLKIAYSETGKYAYSIEDYFSKPKVSSFKLSPNGKYIS